MEIYDLKFLLSRFQMFIHFFKSCLKIKEIPCFWKQTNVNIRTRRPKTRRKGSNYIHCQIIFLCYSIYDSKELLSCRNHIEVYLFLFQRKSHDLFGKFLIVNFLGLIKVITITKFLQITEIYHFRSFQRLARVKFI